MAAFTWLLALTLRSTVVLAMALALAGLLRRTTAVARHRLLTLTAIALLLLPALTRVLPRWELSFVPPWMETPSHEAEGRPPEPPSGATPRIDQPGSTHLLDPLPEGQLRTALQQPPRAPASEGGSGPFGLSFGTAAVGVWLVGLFASLLGLARALRRERRLVAAARPLAGPWLATLAEVRRSLPMPRSVRLLSCEEVQTPLTGGWRNPTVLLPPSAAPWPDERRRVVVQHELVHVMRGDALRHLAWRLVAALYWFHPLARLAKREAAVVGEQACDEAVLDLGTRPSVYARHLLEIAESLRAQPLRLATVLPMIERSQLERRLLMILDPDRSAHRGRAVAAVTLALLAGTVLGVGAAMPLTFGGSARASTSTPQPAAAARPVAPVRSAAAPVPAIAAEPADLARPVCTHGINGTFSGTFNEGPSGTDFKGVTEDDFALQQRFEGGRVLCARVHGPVRFDERDGSIRELPSGSSVVVETREGRSKSQRMLITTEQGERRYQWWLNGVSGEPDEGARAWLADSLEVMAAFRAMGAIEGQVGSLQGAIGSIQGQIGSLQGEIGSIEGEEGSLQGTIGSIQGEEGSLQGEIGSHQGAIGSLEGSRGQASAAQQARIDREIAVHEAAVKKLEAEMASLGFSRRTAEAEADLRAFEKSGQARIAELERQIQGIEAEGRIGHLERQIEDLHAEEQVGEIERRMKPALERLKVRLQSFGR